MRSFAAFVAVAALPMIAADTCQEQTGTHTNAICCATGTSYFAVSPGATCDYETDGNKCQAACCKSTCLSKTATCPAGYRKKAAFDTTESAAGASAAATTASCCERTCKSMSISCPAGKSPIANFDETVCADQAGCDTDCCKKTCASGAAGNAAVTCDAGQGPKAAFATHQCADQAGCTKGECCERTCKSMSISCPAGKSPIANFDATVCADQAGCDTDCCKKTCASGAAGNAAVTCDAGEGPKPAFATHQCANQNGPCTKTECCQATCKSKGVTCDVKKTDYDITLCAGAASTCVDTCCQKTCTHADHTNTVCAAIGSRTFQHKRNSATIVCSTGRTTKAGVATKCDNELCCDLTRVARDVNTVRATLPHTLVSCVENADCRKHGDAGATCNTATNDCSCTNCDDYNFAGHDTFLWPNVRCYQKKETKLVSLVFKKPGTAGATGAAGDVCSNVATTPIPKDVRMAIAAVYTTYSGGKVLTAGFKCVSDKVSVSLQVEIVKGANLKTDVASFNTALAGQTTAIKNKLGGAVETIGTATDVCKKPANVAHQLTVAGACLTQKCDIGYYKKKDTRACTQYVAGTTAAADEFDVCIVDGDCTWRENVGWCVENKCVLNLDTYQRKLKVPTASSKDWCSDDASCRSFGDMNATCSTNVGLGNWCSCVDAAYDYPAGDNVGLCVPTAATAIKFGYTVAYDTGLSCPTTDAQAEGFTALIRKVLGDTNAKVAHRCTGTRVVFLGAADMAKQLALDLASGGSSVFVDKLVAERAVGKAGAATTLTAVVTADRDADALADPYAGLGDAVPTSASVGGPVACPKPFATSTALYNTECIALDCQATHTVIGVDCITITPAPNTTAPVTAVPPGSIVLATDSDDSLSSGEKVGLGVGITVGVLVIIGIVVAALMCGKKAEEPAKADEHEPAAGDDTAV